MLQVLIILNLCIFYQVLSCDHLIEVYEKWHYQSPGYYSHNGYENNLRCSILFKASHESRRIRLRFTMMDVQRGKYGRCSADSVAIYNVESGGIFLLDTICGHVMPTFESAGDQLSLVFITDGHNDRVYKGWSVEYDLIESGSVDSKDDYKYDDSDSDFRIWYVVPFLLVVVVFGYIIYNRCQMSNRINRNINETGHTPADHQMARLTMIRPLTPQGARAQGESTRSTESELYQVRASRRVRHPAGDLHVNNPSSAEQQFHNIDGGLRSDYRGRASPSHMDLQFYSHHLDAYGNMPANNNSADNLNYLGGGTSANGFSYSSLPPHSRHSHQTTCNTNLLPTASLHEGGGASGRSSPQNLIREDQHRHRESPHNPHHSNQPYPYQQQEPHEAPYRYTHSGGAESKTNNPSHEAPPPSYEEVTAAMGGHSSPCNLVFL